MNTERLELLIRDYFDGDITDACMAELDALLRTQPEARARFWQEARMNSALRDLGLAKGTELEMQAAAVSPPALSSRLKKGPWLTWRPLTAAAAGLVIGLFSASLVWAIAVPRSEWRRMELKITNAGFEEPLGEMKGGFPSRSAVWSGDDVHRVPAVDGISPLEGGHFGRLEPVKSGERQFSYMHQIVDLGAPRLTPSQAEVSVAFHSVDAQSAHRFSLRVAGFAEAAEAVRPLWRDSLEASTSATQRAVTQPAGKSGWQVVTARLDLPPGTRSLVIAIGARSLDAAAPLQAHFIDDVKATLLTPNDPLP